MKKWQKIGELSRFIMEDSTLSICADNLKCVTYAPNIGYRSWIFRYKGVLVVLDDAGNGHYDFYTAVSLVDLVAAKLSLLGEWFIERKINKNKIKN